MEDKRLTLWSSIQNNFDVKPLTCFTVKELTFLWHAFLRTLRVWRCWFGVSQLPALYGWWAQWPCSSPLPNGAPPFFPVSLAPCIHPMRTCDLILPFFLYPQFVDACRLPFIDIELSPRLTVPFLCGVFFEYMITTSLLVLSSWFPIACLHLVTTLQ